MGFSLRFKTCAKNISSVSRLLISSFKLSFNPYPSPFAGWQCRSYEKTHLLHGQFIISINVFLFNNHFSTHLKKRFFFSFLLYNQTTYYIIWMFKKSKLLIYKRLHKGCIKDFIRFLPICIPCLRESNPSGNSHSGILSNF